MTSPDQNCGSPPSSLQPEARTSRLSDWTAPWSDAAYRRFENSRAILAQAVSVPSDDLLANGIEILFDESYDEEAAEVFLVGVARQAAREIVVWREHLTDLEHRGLLTKREIEEIIAATKAAQAWHIVVTPTGGRLEGSTVEANPDTQAKGFIPSASAPHRGVAWWAENGVREVGLITELCGTSGSSWDEDIGHEIAHASLAPIPLFSQRSVAGRTSPSLGELWRQESRYTPAVCAKVFCLLSELIVATMRMEGVTGVTTLPGLTTPEEFKLFFRSAAALTPEQGFADLLPEIESSRGSFGMWSDSLLARTRAAALRVAPTLAAMAIWTHGPEL
ncbi:MAG: hypothetical protein WDM79_18695 [Terricaulis sp.]